MDPINLLILIAAFLMVTVVCWALLILYCCIASSCSLPEKPDVLSSNGIYEDPVSLIDMKKYDSGLYQNNHWNRVSHSLASENLYRPKSSFPCQVYFTPYYFRPPPLALSHSPPFSAPPPPLPRRNKTPVMRSFHTMSSRFMRPVVDDVVYV